MKIKLLRDARIRHYAGEIVEVSPAEAQFLTSVGSAVAVSVPAPIAHEQADELKESAKPKRSGGRKKA